MHINVTKVRDGMAALHAGITALRTKSVLVGVPAAEAPREDGEPINNATLAYIHNHGSPAQNIPARPFLEPGIKNAQDEISAGLKKAALSAISGQPSGVTAGLTKAGLAAQASVRSEINDGDFVELAPATIADRLRKGIVSDKPLIRTGEMRNSINYVVRDK